MWRLFLYKLAELRSFLTISLICLSSFSFLRVIVLRASPLFKNLLIWSIYGGFGFILGLDGRAGGLDGESDERESFLKRELLDSSSFFLTAVKMIGKLTSVPLVSEICFYCIILYRLYKQYLKVKWYLHYFLLITAYAKLSSYLHQII